jgi:hypothetical protein
VSSSISTPIELSVLNRKMRVQLLPQRAQLCPSQRRLELRGPSSRSLVLEGMQHTDERRVDQEIDVQARDKQARERLGRADALTIGVLDATLHQPSRHRHGPRRRAERGPCAPLSRQGRECLPDTCTRKRPSTTRPGKEQVSADPLEDSRAARRIAPRRERRGPSEGIAVFPVRLILFS